MIWELPNRAKKTVNECKNSMLQYRKRELPGSAKWVFGEEEGSEEERIGEQILERMRLGESPRS